MIREWNEESLDHRNALLYAMGVTEKEAERPVIGIVNACNGEKKELPIIGKYRILK